MIPFFLASCLAAGVVSSAEFLYILLTGGPFWIRPWDFLLSWVAYTFFMIIGLLLLVFVESFFSFARAWHRHDGRNLLVHYIIGWFCGSLAVIALIVKDLDTAAGIWLPILLTLLLGAIILLILSGLIRDREPLFPRPAQAMLVLLGVNLLAFWASDLSASTRVKARSIAFQGALKHISLIVLDTTRGDHFSCYGYPYNTTPNFDRIAFEGWRGDQAYSASNWTPPGHISIFTGKYPSQHGNKGQPFTPDELLTLTEILREGGYYCVALYNNPLAGKNINLTQGFDVDIGVYRHSWVFPAWMRLRDKLVEKDSGSKPTFTMALRTSKWVESKGGHLFIYLNLVEPHADYVIHEPYFTELTQDLVFDHIPNLSEVQELCNYLEKVIYDSVKFGQYNRASFRYLEAVYDSELAYMDHCFGAYSDGLRSSGLLDQTLVVITADHGEFLGEHFTRGHPDILYNPVLRIPLIMRHPDKIQEGVETGYTSNVDIFPTVLHLTGYEQALPADVQGMNLFSGFDLTERSLLSERVKEIGGSHCLFQNSHKLMLYTDPDFLQKFPFDTLLVNYIEDPGEWKDLHNIELELTLSMSEVLADWRYEIEVQPTRQIELNDQTIKNLKALGYVN